MDGWFWCGDTQNVGAGKLGVSGCDVPLWVPRNEPSSIYWNEHSKGPNIPPFAGWLVARKARVGLSEGKRFPREDRVRDPGVSLRETESVREGSKKNNTQWCWRMRTRSEGKASVLQTTVKRLGRRGRGVVAQKSIRRRHGSLRAPYGSSGSSGRRYEAGVVSRRRGGIVVSIRRSVSMGPTVDKGIDKGGAEVGTVHRSMPWFHPHPFFNFFL